MALDLLSSIRYLLKPEDISIDNFVFRLHYKMTVLVLLASSVVGVAKQYFGDPINCQTASGVSSKVMDDYCWIHSTFHVRNEFQGNVGCILDTELESEPASAVHIVAADTPDTAFYQWVPFTLVFQALLFYFPRKLWKSFEGGLMESFGRDAKKGVLLDDDCHLDVESALYRETVAKKYAGFFHSTLHHNNGYFVQFLVCEVLNFLVDLFNIYFTDVFLGGRFLRYGARVIKFYSHPHSVRRDMPNPMCTVFPTVTSCTFHSVGTAAGEQKYNSLCVLSLNIINEKIYLFLWFWFFLLAAVTATHLLFRVAVIAIPFTRSFLILVRARMFSNADMRTVRKILSRCYLGDWWVLYQLGRNSNTHFYRFLLRYIEMSLSSTTSSGINGNRRRRVRYLDEDVGSQEDEDDSMVEESNGIRKRNVDDGEEQRKKRKHKTKIAMPYTV